MDKICKNCAFWRYEECNGMDWTDSRNIDSKEKIQIIVDVDDDSGLEVRIKTKPSFSCGNFKPRGK